MVAKQTQLWPEHKHSGAIFKTIRPISIKKLAVTQSVGCHPSRNLIWLKNFSAFLHGLGRQLTTKTPLIHPFRAAASKFYVFPRTIYRAVAFILSPFAIWFFL